MKKYVEPEIKVTAFDSECIMTLSGINGEGSMSGTVVKPSDSNESVPYAAKVEVAF